jgi:hypothetical protein
MSDKMTLFELKERAKWSRDSEEKKTAIKELSTHGENAISELQEIMITTAYGDIKNACAEAIKSIQAGSNVEAHKTSTNDGNSAADVIAKDQKKEKFEKDGETPGENQVRLADLPP